MIQELREHALTNDNTAQIKLLDYLDNHLPSIDELIINEALSGDIDLEVIEKCNFKNITSIVFAPGHITTIINIPKNIRKFVCSHNLLTHLDNIPISIEILEVPENAIHHINFQPLTKLNNLNINNNKFEVLENLPKSLEIILCDNNEIRRIDLAHLSRLKTIHCSNNGLMRIENIPDTVSDFEMENNPLLEIHEKVEGKIDIPHTHTSHQIEYTDALNQYFKWKNEYEIKSHNQRKNVFERIKIKSGIKRAQKETEKVKPICIYCKRPVGMIFIKKEDHFIGQCGDESNPCLDIKLYAGEHMSLQGLIDEYRDLEEYMKELIISLKYDTLFNFKNEAESTKKFNSQMKEYNDAMELLKEFEDKYENIYFSEMKKEKLEKKAMEIGEIRIKMNELYRKYLVERNPEVLRLLLEMHTKELHPNIAIERRLKYDVMEMDITNDNLNILVQKTAGISHIDYINGEMPKVVKWVKK
jgi:hypothetical protein